MCSMRYVGMSCDYELSTYAMRDEREMPLNVNVDLRVEWHVDLFLMKYRSCFRSCVWRSKSVKAISCVELQCLTTANYPL